MKFNEKHEGKHEIESKHIFQKIASAGKKIKIN